MGSTQINRKWRLATFHSYVSYLAGWVAFLGSLALVVYELGLDTTTDVSNAAIMFLILMYGALYAIIHHPITQRST